MLQVREKSKLYGEISFERLRLFLNAFCAENSNCTAAYISQAKSLGCTSTKLAQKIRTMQGIMQWEEFPLKLLPFCIASPSSRLQAIPTSLKGMEMALASTTSSPKITKDQNLKDYILNLQRQINTNIIGSTSIKTQSSYPIYQPPQPLNDLPQTPQELPPLFFLFCIKLLFVNRPQRKAQQEETSDARRRITKRLVIALKCSLILGFATFLGLLFSKPDGYWAVLTVAVTFSPSRQSTFRIATARAHGTAIGSFFGVMGTLVSEDHMELRLLLLVPWIVFTTFLQRSKIYGQAGAMAAVLSAMIIMGRRGYGSPIMFTIDRLTETYIGFCCVIFVELIVQPTSARLVASLQALDECIESIKNINELKVKERELVKRVNQLKKYVEEAQLEPNLWFLPFPAACYCELHRSLTSIGDLLLFLVHGLESLDQECREIDEAIKGDLDKFKESVGGLVKGLVEVIKVNSLDRLEKDLKRKAGGSGGH
ncbi:uncharacterized protein A4U43_C02F1600 [Asparagus officinalis]|uniref:Integral membrane bound transporter domain-containing protein n=1 Tax=Asparagus officinalis TaxID=4686 RepID=A0A5P1FFR2_ASPOF|nr:uncharacterized protein A4U43_C02F1600 [Asparagus officinalis]